MTSKFKRKKILIVDDDKEMRQAIRRLLTVAGNYEINEAKDGCDAEEQLKNFSPNLVILDIKMPGKDGYEICSNIRSNINMKNVKIIGLSGISGGIGAAFMEALGADYYFEKPFDNNIFKNKIFKLLEEKQFINE